MYQCSRLRMIRRLSRLVCCVMILVTLLLVFLGGSAHAEGGKLKIQSVPTATTEDDFSHRNFQLLVMDFADEYMAALDDALDDYITGESNAAKRVAAQSWKIRYDSSAMRIAAARDPRTNLLDMVVFISAGKWAVNAYWIPKVFGEKAARLSEVYQEMDRKVWTLTEGVLSSQQQQNLHQLLKNWENSHPRMDEVANARLRNLNGVHLSAFDDGHAAWGILASVQRLLKRVDTSLLSGERLMFCLEHTPQILALQGGLTISQVGQSFPIAAVRPELIATAVKDFPSVLQEGIDHNAGSLATLLPQIGATLESANSLAKNLHESIQSVNMLEGNTNLSRADPSALMRDASLALTHLDSSIHGINQLLEKNPAGVWNTAELAHQIDVQTTSLMDAVFYRILLLIAVFFGGVAIILLLVKGLFLQKSKKGSE